MTKQYTSAAHTLQVG